MAAPLAVSMQFMDYVRRACTGLHVFYVAPWTLKFVNAAGDWVAIPLDNVPAMTNNAALEDVVRACRQARFLLG